MAKVSGAIPNLINGVSQQPSALRLPTQCEEQVNCFSTVVEGLKKRPPTETIAKLASSLTSSAHIHVINRDETERYIVVITNGDLKVYDFTGDEKTVAFPDGKGYLTNTNPNTGFSTVTVADFTFIANKATDTAMDATIKSTARDFEAIVNVKLGHYGKTYKIFIDGVQKATYTTKNGGVATDAPDIDTVNIATELYNDLNVSPYNAAPWTLTRYGNAVYLANSTTDFAIAIEDGFNKKSMTVAKDTIQDFSDLPVFGPDGFVVEVSGDDATNFDNFWVKFLKTDPQDGSGVWKETVEPDIVVGLGAATMPHSLVRETDGTFTFQEDIWDDRLVGDADTVPDPSFIDFKITDIFFAKNRLGFISDENVVMSRAGDFYNFFPTTATTVRDDDPIDISVSHTKVSLLRHAIPYKDWVFLYSDQTQFRLKGEGGILTPQTASIDILSEYDVSSVLSPITSEQSVFFGLDRGEFSAIVEYFYDAASESVTDNEITSHVPKYLPTGVFKLAASGIEDTMIALSSNDLDAMYVYKYFWTDQREKLQSSWSIWEFPGVTRIYDAEFLASDLYMVVERSDGVWLERIKAEPGLIETGKNYVVSLDRKIHSDDTNVTPVYSSGNDETTYTFQYGTTTDIVAVVRDGDSEFPDGYEMALKSQTSNTVVLDGDTTSLEFIFGFEYDALYKFTQFLPRKETSGGGFIVEIGTRLQLQRLKIQYDSSSYFEVDVDLQGRDTSTYVFNGRIIGSETNVEGAIALESGTFSVPLLSRAERAEVTVKSSKWLPFSLLGAEWTGRLIKRTRSI